MNHDHSQHTHARRYTGLTIDTHAHWYPREWIDLVQKDGHKEGAVIEFTPVDVGREVEAAHARQTGGTL